jgi:hypothetical protein
MNEKALAQWGLLHQKQTNKQTKSEYDAKVANINLTMVLFHKNESLPGAGVRGQRLECAGQNRFLQTSYRKNQDMSMHAFCTSTFKPYRMTPHQHYKRNILQLFSSSAKQIHQLQGRGGGRGRYTNNIHIHIYKF